ncbi:putative ABC transport system permease protein [Streptomyces sp. LBL]|uniref:FtsX-like permease family protein n=1 Tax=Streptomyces sp. LBL TaxID=2940562 RepID=UPI002474651A|nr:ABC transporter permease [Streptomyces sp. LBL]MDH6626467.1 putative ABC transport system permease protein [Streptomyces sp. LBL]
MLSIGLSGLRNRWTHFVGAFLAVALGAGLTVSMGLALAATSGAPQSLKDQDPDAVFRVNAMLATAATVTTFTSVFVVASTFAFSVAQRRREFGLLRTAGATPGQVRAAVVTEAGLVGASAALVGCLLGRLGGSELVGWMVDERLAPAWLTVGDQWWPYQLGFWSGLLVAVVGALAASRRASHTSAVEVLRESDVDRRVMTGGRWAFGGLLLAIGLALLAGKVAADPADLLKRKTYTTQPLLLIGAFALLAPVAVRPLVRLAGWLPSRLPGASGMLVRESATGSVRRTAAVAAPVLVSVALVGSLLGATATVGAGRADEIRDRTNADFVVTADSGGRGLSGAALDAVRAVPGTRSAVSAPTVVEYLVEGVARVPDPGRAVDPATFAGLARLPLVEGSLDKLDDRSIVVNEEWGASVGGPVDIWREDGSKVRLTVAAVLRTGTGSNGVYVTAANAPGATPDRVEVRLKGGADRAAVAAGLREAVRGAGATVATTEQWIAASQPDTKRENRLAVIMVIGLVVLYALIALAGTMVMATSDRMRDLAVLRLTGATRGQVLRVVALEAVTVVAVGSVLGVLVSGVNVLGVWSAVSVLVGGAAPLSVPWAAIAIAAAACLVVAVPAAVGAAAVLVRRGTGARPSV